MILKNKFHSTQYATRKTSDELDDIQPWLLVGAERLLIWRINRALCGMNDCVCGGFWGERPSIDIQKGEERDI